MANNWAVFATTAAGARHVFLLRPDFDVDSPLVERVRARFPNVDISVGTLTPEEAAKAKGLTVHDWTKGTSA